MSEICQIAGYPPSVAGTEGRGHPLPHSPSKPCPVCTADNPRSSARAANGKMRAKFGFPMAIWRRIASKPMLFNGGLRLSSSPGTYS